ncbi:MAG: hypothetical protein IPK79_07445 [Vampirovibrionales bacterium]|nr:hypothetical protein [Vampirovibrionales bacterium]
MAERKSNVCVHVLESLDGLEIIRFHEKTRRIEKAGALPLSLDPNTRAIPDPAELRAALRSLYSVHGIALSSPTVLVLPSFYTRDFYFPGPFSEQEIRQALLSEAEQYFLFRNNEPRLDWVTLEEGRLLYSAYPKNTITEFVEAFAANRTPLCGIDINYFSLIRGLIATGTLADLDKPQSRWMLMNVSDHLFTAALFEGLKLKRLSESPLPLATMDASTAIVEINQDLRRFLAGENFEAAVLINNAERLDTAPLVDSFSYYQEIMVIDQNQRTLRSRNPAAGEYPCSLEAIGGAFYQHYADQPSLNLIPEDLGRQREGQTLRTSLTSLLGVANVAAALLLLAAITLLGIWNQQQQTRLDAWNSVSRASGPASESAPLEMVSRQAFLRNAALSNISLNNLMIKAGALLPDDMWMNRLSLVAQDAADPQTVEIVGGALMPTSVTKYVSELNPALQRRDLLVDRADLATTADGQPYYDWIVRSKNAMVESESNAKGADLPPPLSADP